jgi:hypothetical protein
MPQKIPSLYERYVVAYRRNQHPIASLNARLHDLALLVETARANGQDSRLVQLLDGRLWEEDAAGGLGFGLDALDEDAVQERRQGLDGLESGGLQEDKLVWCFCVELVGEDERTARS